MSHMPLAYRGIALTEHRRKAKDGNKCERHCWRDLSRHSSVQLTHSQKIISANSSQILSAKFWINAGFLMMYADEDTVVGNQVCLSRHIFMHACMLGAHLLECVCPSRTLPSPILSPLTLFNLESNQICAETRGPVRHVSFSSPQTSPPDVHYGICLAVLKLSHCFFLILSPSLSVCATLFSPMSLNILLCTNNIHGISFGAFKVQIKLQSHWACLLNDTVSVSLTVLVRFYFL